MAAGGRVTGTVAAGGRIDPPVRDCDEEAATQIERQMDLVA